MTRKRGRPPYPDLLTPREQEVLALLREGLSNEQIATRLGITLGGAKFHVSEILGKLGVSSRREAALWPGDDRRWWRLPALASVSTIRNLHFGIMQAAVGATAIVVVVAGVGLLAWGVAATQTDEGLRAIDPQRIALARSDVPGFTLLGEPDAEGEGQCDIDRGSRASGFDNSPPTERERSFITCGGSGYTVSSAYSPEALDQINAIARLAGYQPALDRPFIPIQGSFVSTYSGVFEIFDQVLVFATEEGAHEQFERITDPREAQYFNYVEPPSDWGDESHTRGGVLGPDPQLYQTSYVTTWRRGRVVAWVNTMGAPDLDVSDNARLVAIMDQRIRAELGE